MARFSDPDWASPEAIDGAMKSGAPRFQCADCQAAVRIHGHGVITNDGGSRQLCDPCFRWRSARCLVFDPRPRRELESLVA